MKSLKSLPVSMHSTILVFDLILLFFTLPFIATSYHYSTHDHSCIYQKGTQIKLTLRQWMLIDATILLSFIVFLILTSLLYMVTPKCLCFHSAHFYLTIVLGVFRLAWLIVGGILFWNDIYKRGKCEKAIQRFIYADLVIGFIYELLYFVAGCLFPRPTIRVPYQIFKEIQQIDPGLTPRHLLPQK